MTHSKSRPSDKTKLKLLLDKLAGLDFKPGLSADGWYQAFLPSVVGIDLDQMPRAVSLDDFFVGNPNTTGTFASNLSNHPGEDALYTMFKQFLERNDVYSVYIGVTQMEFRMSDPDAWVYADTLYITSSASDEQIKSWFGDTYPDDIFEVPKEAVKTQFGLVLPRQGYKLYCAWWD